MELGVDPVAGISSADSSVSLSDLQVIGAENAHIEAAMSEAVAAAIDLAASTPTHSADLTNDRKDLAGIDGGVTRSEQDALLSEIHREGAVPAVSDDSGGIEEVAASIGSLMEDLAVWHVTWNVAQSTQKDLTHILKSS